jgi:hypothetical protein
VDHHHHEKLSFRQYLGVEVTHPRLVIMVALAAFFVVGLALGFSFGKDSHDHRLVSEEARKVSE